jgi:hypothetical protein
VNIESLFAWFHDIVDFEVGLCCRSKHGLDCLFLLFLQTMDETKRSDGTKSNEQKKVSVSETNIIHNNNRTPPNRKPSWLLVKVRY